MSVANFGISLHTSAVSKLTRSETFSSITLLHFLSSAEISSGSTCSSWFLYRDQYRVFHKSKSNVSKWEQRITQTEGFVSSLAHLRSHLLLMGSSSIQKFIYGNPLKNMKTHLEQPSSSFAFRQLKLKLVACSNCITSTISICQLNCGESSLNSFGIN